MSEADTQISVALPEHIESQIQNRALGLIQAEFGVLQTNYFSLQARVEALTLQRGLDLGLIEALKKRAFEAENNVRILQEQYLAEKSGREALESELSDFRKKRSRTRKHENS